MQLFEDVPVHTPIPMPTCDLCKVNRSFISASYSSLSVLVVSYLIVVCTCVHG